MASLQGPTGATTDLANMLAESRERFLGYIRGKVSDPELAEDILQDSLLKAVQAAAKLKDEELLVPWFQQIVRNAIVDAYRRRGVARTHTVPLAADIAEASADHAAACECFRALVPALKPEYADLIQALDLGTETPEQAAGRLGISATNLKVRRYRARQALRRRLEETCRTCAAHHCLDCTCKT